MNDHFCPVPLIVCKEVQEIHTLWKITYRYLQVVSIDFRVNIHALSGCIVKGNMLYLLGRYVVQPGCEVRRNRVFQQFQLMSLIQDSRGYIWAGTKAGLSKYDGERFENFFVKDGLPGAYVKDLIEDPTASHLSQLLDGRPGRCDLDRC